MKPQYDAHGKKMKTNAQRQAEFKARMRKMGYDQVQVWIRPEHKERLRKIAAKMREEELHEAVVKEASKALYKNG